METQKVGLREFREKLSTAYIVASSSPLAIMRHGNTVGCFTPFRLKAGEADWAAFMDASHRARESLEAAGLTEDDIIEDFKMMKAEERAKRATASGA